MDSVTHFHSKYVYFYIHHSYNRKLQHASFTISGLTLLLKRLVVTNATNSQALGGGPGLQGQSPPEAYRLSHIKYQNLHSAPFLFLRIFLQVLFYFFHSCRFWSPVKLIQESVLLCLKKQMTLFDDQKFSRLGTKMLKQLDNRLCTLCGKFLFLRLFQSKYSVKIFNHSIISKWFLVTPNFSWTKVLWPPFSWKKIFDPQPFHH